MPGLRELWAWITRWKVDLRWYALLILTAALASLSLVLSPDSSLKSFVTYSGAPEIAAIALSLLVIGGFGEEIGWRGYLADRLLNRFSIMSTAVIVWVVWAGWHLALFSVVGNFRDLWGLGLLGWFIGMLCGSVLLTWLYSSAQRSVLIVALWHAAYNFTTATEAATGVGAAVATTMIILTVVILAFRPSLRRRPIRRSLGS